MKTIIFILIVVIFISLTIFISLREKKSCLNCGSKNISKTGKKIYQEEPAIAILGSPSSYHQLEYKCNSCGHLFFIKQKAIIFN